ncbi:hypothetical protein HG536_0G01960 [Torulaspora globosa]|uniref:Uncharacterized protein n=1 Tax=Torulaspora globosa TaxID=48254 RepID=A0A7G3ZLF1_9SACH|nr:uncharacterized protein HG536_0G01960 [Torulaspora globosa]QLL34337.1 hypothetical protein HG536_0G01960 [Torulaspora globosa]
MDKLAELEEKKRQLKQLRERRLYAGRESLVDHLLQGRQQDRNRGNGYMVCRSVQTDAAGEITPLAPTRITTYDKMVQTTVINGDEASTVEDSGSDELESASDTELAPEHDKVKPLASVMVEDQQNTVKIKSFSVQEVLDESFPRENALLSGKCKSGILPIYRWNAELEERAQAELRPVCLDNIGNLVAVLFQSTPVDRNDVLMAPWSYLFVLKWDARQVVDKIEFRGQTITKARFLRKDIASNVISLLAVSHTGKTTLTELRCVEDLDSVKKLERNIISKNVFATAVPALEEYRGVPPGHERFIAASSNGVLNELSSLDLSIYADATSCQPPLSNIKVVPPRPSELVVVGHHEDDEEGGNMETKSGVGEEKFRQHLLKISLFDSLAISAISLSPSDSRLVYAGTEDGGIYKLNLDKIQDGTLKIFPTNDGFLPTKGRAALSGNSLPMFHSSHVVALSHNADELLMSASFDWTCALWDPLNCSQLATIDMGSPVLDAAWLDDESRFCGILTWDALSIVEWQYHAVTDANTLNDRWESTMAPKIICRLSSNEASCRSFTCFKNFKRDDVGHVFAVGCDDQEIRFYSMALQS